MKTKICATKVLLMTTALLATAVTFGGCADYASVDVASGYGPTYYAPDYRPYFSAYLYDGIPWWGPNAYYVRKKVVVRDVDKNVNVNRNIYYGRHHLVRDWRGTRTVARTPSGRARVRR
ncbi:MAG: hypothetical protein QOI34_1064 [Verrucomicrobiota bacterium]|jgi:hypothetical protein